MHENLRYEHGKPHTGWSSCESRRSVSFTKIHSANTESPHLGIPASRVIKNTQRTRKARTCGATCIWLSVKKGLEIEGSVID